MSLLPKPRTASKPKAKRAKRETGKVIHEGSVEPMAGWTVTFHIVEDKSRTSEFNPDGRFVRFTGGINWQPDKSLGTAMAYAAVVDALRKANA
jgi:hypothetical protein